MTTRPMFFLLCATVVALSACHTYRPAEPAQAVDSTKRTTSATEQAMNRMFHWREEARELYEMAAHREREAEVLSKAKPRDAWDDEVVRLRRLARQLRAVAEYADAQAQQAQRQASADVAP